MNVMNTADIAIVGIACRVPGARNHAQFWDNLKGGINSIKEIPPKRWDTREYYSSHFHEPHKSISKWCGLVDNIERFDHRFFQISPREANNMDPQQRLLLEEAWHCIEDSGIALTTLQSQVTSVYIGFMAVDYYKESWGPDVVTDSYAGLGNYGAILANRLSYAFDFRGTSMSIDTACASSLVALHHAKQSLISGESAYALAGGVSLNFHPWKYISFSKSRMLSPDGQCKTFDKDANGYVPGDGVGLVLLQRLDEALRSGNHIYGVLKGTAVNHGGSTMSITAPRVEAQRDVILAAYQDAGFSPDTVSYVEAHGTGTSLGDPIEVEALTRAFREFTQERQFCKIGSVKTNIGHLEAAAGIAGVIKVLLMMQHRQIPKTLNIRMLNPIIAFKDSPFEVALTPTDWSARAPNDRLRAGISSFGFGGVNSHVLLESLPPKRQKGASCLSVRGLPAMETGDIFVLSAKTRGALESLREQWEQFVKSKNYGQYRLHDICGTLLTGRAAFSFRYGCYVKNTRELAACLEHPPTRLSQETPRAWNLRIGPGSDGSYVRILPLMSQLQLFHQHVDTLHECLTAIHSSSEQQDCREISTVLHSIESFVIDHAYLSTIMEMGFAPDVVTYERTGVWGALVLSGMLQPQDVFAVLTKRKALHQLRLARPRLPFYDPVTRRTFRRYHFDRAYLTKLIKELVDQSSLSEKILFDAQSHTQHREHHQEVTRLGALLMRKQAVTRQQLREALREQSQTGQLIGAVLIKKQHCSSAQIDDALREQEFLRKYVDEVMFHYMDKARLLSESQFTFKKYLEEWDRILIPFGVSLEDMLHDNEMLSSRDEHTLRKRVLLMLIVIISLHRLNKKWNLSEDRFLGDSCFYELMDLVLDGVMPEETLVELLLSDAPNYASISSILDSRQALLNSEKPYPCITNYSRQLWEIPDAASWIEQALSTIAPPDFDKQTGYLDFGSLGKYAPHEQSIRLEITEPLYENFKQALLLLWQRGVNIQWKLLYPEGSFQKVALPVYPFEGRACWIPREDFQRASAPVSSAIKMSSMDPQKPILTLKSTFKRSSQAMQRTEARIRLPQKP